MKLSNLLKPTLTREIGLVFVTLALLGLFNCATCIYLLMDGSYGAGGPQVARDMTFHWLLIAAVNAAIVAGGLWAVSARIAAPIRRLHSAAGRIAAGDFSARVREAGLFDELRDLAVSFNTMARTVEGALGRLEVERDFARGVLDLLPEAVAVINTNEKVMYANRPFRNIFGMDSAEEGVRTVGKIIPDKDAVRMVREALVDRKDFSGVRIEWGPWRDERMIGLKISVRPVWRSKTAPERALLIVEKEPGRMGPPMEGV